MGSAHENERDAPELSPRARELGEDVEVAILEFLDRHPHTSQREIRLALRSIEHGIGELIDPDGGGGASDRSTRV